MIVPDGVVYPQVDADPLPCNLQAECFILGAILLDNEAFNKTLSLEPDDFSLSAHKLIYLRIKQMLERKSPVDLVTLAEEMIRNKDDICETPTAYLAGLTDGIFRTGFYIDEYVAIVKEKAKLRRIMAVCETATAKAQEQVESAANIVTEMAKGLKGIKGGKG